MKTKVTIVRVAQSGWMGIYVNGKLKSEGESISPETAFEVLGIDFYQKPASKTSYRVLPKRLEDL